LAREISLDHLIEIPDYYTRLKKMEKEGIKYWSDIKIIEEDFQMSNLKKYDEFVNELKSSTWKSASKRATELNQTNLAKKFKDKYFKSIQDQSTASIQKWREENKDAFQKRKEENIELKITSNYTFDYYVDSYTNEDDYYYEDVVKMTIGDWGDWGESYAFITDYENIDRTKEREVILGHDWDEDYEEDGYEDGSILSKIDIINEPPYITEINHPRNKFANKRSALKFLEMMKKLYIVQDYNKNAQIMAKINGETGSVSEVKNGEFREYIDNNFGSWDKFRSLINIRKLYDTY
jgi:hypothetical protein